MNRSRSHIHVWGHAETSVRPPGLSRAACALTGGRESRQIDLEDAGCEDGAACPVERIRCGFFHFWQTIWYLPADMIALPVLEVELPRPTTTSECARFAGEAW